MIKKISTFLLLLTFFQFSVNAQTTTDQRTITTRIADLLAQLPALDAKQLRSTMLEIDQLGEKGFVTLIGGLTPPGKGNNASLEYAIGGYSAYVMQNGKENERSRSVRALCSALESASDKQVKEFLISQLEIVGKDDAVACLKNYLSDWQLADPASRALVKINSTAAQAALNEALSRAQGLAKLSIIEALGLSRTKEAVTVLNSMATSHEPNVSKVTLSALAHIAHPSSADILKSAAQKANYYFDQDNATASLLMFADNLVKEGNNTLASTTIQNIHNSASAGNQIHVRTAALHILARADKENASNMLIAAMDDKDIAYRGAALKFAVPLINEDNTTLWLKKLSKVDNETKIQIVDMLAEANAKSALPAFMKLIKNNDQKLSIAAISAVSTLGQASVIPDLYKVMRKGDHLTISAVTAAILRMKGENISQQLAAYLHKSNPQLQVALLHVLAARAATEQTPVVYSLLNHKQPEVKAAAYTALKQMVTDKDVQTLFNLLKETDTQQQSVDLQDAIISAMRSSSNLNGKVEKVLSELNAAPQERRTAYYKILAALGGKEALRAVSQAYLSNGADDKKAAILALASWRNAESLPVLLKISQNTTDEVELNQAISGYLRLVRTSKFTPEQKYLKLREILTTAKTDNHKLTILKDLDQVKTFNAILLAGEYLDNPVLQQAAANTVMTIVLADKDYHGSLIRGLLNRTIDVLKGGDSEYQKEAMRKYLAEMSKEEGFVSIFNGKDLTGWKGLVGDPIKRSKMDAKTLAVAQKKADELMLKGWKAEEGELRFQIHGDNLATIKKYGDVEMLVDWKIIDDKKQKGDAGIYLRGTPQVQIWDTARVKDGAQVGSGGLYNNQVNPSKPLKVADNALDEWNTFRIIMKGDRVTVYLNGELVTDNVILENYWDRNLPIFAEEQIELQAHGSPIAYRNLYIREIPRVKPFQLSATEKKEGYKILFDGTNMHEWVGNTTDYIIENGDMAIRPRPGKGSGGNLFTKNQYADFILKFEFQLTPGANNGLGIRAPLTGDAAYEGMELQILDNDAPVYKSLQKYQYHGSIYGIAAAKRGYLKPVGEWNNQEVVVKGSKVKVTLNGNVILDADISEAAKNGAADGKSHPGLSRTTGHIGFLGHGSPVKFKNIRIKDLTKK